MKRAILRQTPLTALLALILGVWGCKGQPKAAAPEQVLMELRGPSGHLRLQLAKGGDNFGDERITWFASREEGGTLQRLPGAAGTLSLAGSHLSLRRADNGDLAMTANARLKLSIDRRGDTVRVGNGEGFPLARIRMEEGVARMHGPGGELQASARLEGDRISVADREGKALGYLSGTTNAEQALLAFLPGLSPVEMALLIATPVPAIRAQKP